MKTMLAAVLYGREDVRAERVAVQGGEVRAGEGVAVVGAGPLGLMRVCLARERGARVYCIARRPERLALAKQLGAEATLNLASEAEPAAWLRERVPGGRGADRV